MSKKLQQPETIGKLELIARLEEKEKSRIEMKKYYETMLSEKIEQINKSEKNFQILINEVEQKAFSNGQLSVWQSLSINAQPFTRKEGWLTNANYLSIEISVGNHVFFKHSVKTEEKEAGFGSTFAAITSIASVLPYFKLIL